MSVISVSRVAAAPTADHLPSGLAEMAAALAEGTVTARQLTERSLRRIAASQPELNAFRIVRAEAALAEADAADRRLAAGERLPLLGVPLAVKDDMDVAGLPTAFGCAGVAVGGPKSEPRHQPEHAVDQPADDVQAIRLRHVASSLTAPTTADD